VDAVAPGVAEGFDLFGFAGDVVGLAVLDVAGGGGPLEVGVEFDAVGRVDIDALNLAAQAFPFGQRRHDLEGVAENHAVRPVGVVLIELRFRAFVWQTIEVGEKVYLLVLSRLLLLLCSTHKLVYEDLGMDLFLDIERWRLDNEIRPILQVFPSPNELRIKIAVTAFVGNLNRRLVFFAHHGLVLGSGDVSPRRLVVSKKFHLLWSFLLSSSLCHPSPLIDA
jgi:hypothetical protein